LDPVVILLTIPNLPAQPIVADLDTLWGRRRRRRRRVRGEREREREISGVRGENAGRWIGQAHPL
jgi:hypothetical protein